MLSSDPGAAVAPTGPVSPPDASITVGVLGELVIRRATALHPVPGARARVLLTALAVRPGRSRGPHGLIDDIWGDRPPRSPMNALHTQISRLRAALPDGAVEIGPAGYRLTLDAERVDLTRAQRRAHQARRAHAAGDTDRCLGLVAEARALWRGEPGADLPPGPVADELIGAAADCRRALDELESVTRETIGDLAGAVVAARRLAIADPLNELAHATLMRLLARAGRGSEALEVFTALRTRLVDELGADPEPALVELNTAILRGEPIAAPAAVADIRPPARLPPDTEVDAAPGPSAIGLRAAPNPLLGRAADLDALAESVRTCRVTTVLGPGGVGKTRIAHELGARFVGDRAVALVELVSLRPDPVDPEATRAEIESAISATLGIGETGRDPAAVRHILLSDIRRRLRDALDAGPTLLILDNCEHLIDAVARVVADLIATCGRLTVLTTSRAPLEITAETVYPLLPLATDTHDSPATELFTARARAVRPSVRLDPDTVARLCRTLDGLPLAIELAAARVRTMSVADIESRLERRFALLRGGDRSSPERHRTLYAVIEWSWNLLDEPQRITLRRLCRFPDGFTLAAAALVAGGSEVGDTAAAVEGLVGQSLLTVSDEGDGIGIRYRMLETVREFGEERLGAVGEEDLVERRMCRWAREVARDAVRRYPTDAQVSVVLATLSELDNLLAVVRRALDRRDADTVYTVFPVIGALWMMRGSQGEAMSWSERLIALPPPPARERIDGDLHILTAALLTARTVFLTHSVRDFTVVRTRCRRLLRSDVPLTPLARYIGELICVRPGGYRFARELERGARSPDPLIAVMALTFRANIRENAGDPRGSLRDSERAYRMRIVEHVWGTAMVRQHLGQLAAQSGRYSEAVDHYRDAVDALHRLRAYDEGLEIRSYLAMSMVGSGEYEQARRQLEFADRFVDGGPDDPVSHPNHRRAIVTCGWSELALACGDVDTGLRRGRAALESTGWPSKKPDLGPGDTILACQVLDAHILYRGLDAVPELPRQLTGVALERLSQFQDLPQLGMVAITIGSYLLASGGPTEIGCELFALAEQVFARQDSPSMNLARHLELHRPVVDAGAATAAQHSVAGLGRRRAAERILELIGSVHDRIRR